MDNFEATMIAEGTDASESEDQYIAAWQHLFAPRADSNQQAAASNAGMAWWDNVGGCGVSGGAAGGSSGAHSMRDSMIPREGSLPARIIAWSDKHGREFSTIDLVKKFGVTRAHGSMLLAKLANGAYPIVRQHRGVYQHAG